LAEFASFQGSS